MKQAFNITLLSLIAWLAWAGITAPADAQEAVSPDPSDFQAYALIQERNIFNPNRYRISENRPPPSEPGSEPDPVRIEFFTLLGTMSYEKGCYAYFNGSDAEFRKIVQTQDTIGEHKVLEISDSNVRLEHGGKELRMKVGMQLKRQNQGEWELVSEPSGSLRASNSRRSRDSRGSRSPGHTVNASGETDASADSSSEDDEIL